MTLLTSSHQTADLSRSALPVGDLRELIPTPAPIDVARLTDQCFGNLDFAITLLDAFAETALDRFDALAQQVAQNNLDEVAAMAHGLRGVVAMLAMHSVARILVTMESAVDDRDLASLQALVPELRSEMQQALDCIATIRSTSLRQQTGSSDQP